jgi:hypothetical protein
MLTFLAYDPEKGNTKEESQSVAMKRKKERQCPIIVVMVVKSIEDIRSRCVVVQTPE